MRALGTGTGTPGVYAMVADDVPASLGLGRSGRSDVSEHADELLRDGFGR
ncbi:hypothetical protein GCM10010278_71190 [Streptomyces melanogenes]|nr:hypothetical protein GCM10010278_71190 [Streptomyces melanogenes]